MSTEDPQKTTVTAKIKAAVQSRFSAPDYATLFEVANGTGGLAQRKIDALVMSLYPSRGLHLMGLEFKASRADWLRELNEPSKADVIHQYVDFFSIVAGDDKIVKREELPEGWGLWLLKSGGGLREAVKAKKNPHKQPISPAFLAAVLRRAAEPQQKADRQALWEEFQRGREDGKEWHEPELKRLGKELAELETSVKTAERELGFSIAHHWRYGVTAQDAGIAIKAIQAGHNITIVEELTNLSLAAERISENLKRDVDAVRKFVEEIRHGGG